MSRMWCAIVSVGGAASLLSASVASAQPCPPGVVPQPEVCNEFDDDCDGQLNELPEEGGAPRCSTYPCREHCLQLWQTWLCADEQSCHDGEFPCPGGEGLIHSDAGLLCVPMLEDACRDCSSASVLSDSLETLCAPEGRVRPDGTHPPPCVWKGADGCVEPCHGVTCTPGSTCTDYGPNAGRCALPNCYNVPCPAGQACLDGECADNPCKVDTCGPEQACKPDSSLSGYQCTPPCQTDSCGALQVCIGGICVPQPCPVCGPEEVCDPDAGVCIPSKCASPYCADGSTCNALTGDCGASACEGVVCPAGTACHGGECWSVPPVLEGGCNGDAGDSEAEDLPGAPDVAAEPDASDPEAPPPDASAAADGRPGESSASGCSCSQTGARGGRGPASEALAALMLVLLVLTRCARTGSCSSYAVPGWAVRRKANRLVCQHLSR